MSSELKLSMILQQPGEIQIDLDLDLTMTSPQQQLSAHIKDLGSLFRPAPPQPGPSAIVPAEHLGRGEAITILRCSAIRGVYAVPHIISMTALHGEVSLDVHPKQGARRSVDLKRFETLTLWPGTMYRIGEPSQGDLLRIERDLRGAPCPARDSLEASCEPASGYTIHTPEIISREEGISLVLPPHVSPGFELRLVSGFTSNTPHYHMSFSEAYHIVEGEMRLQLSKLSGDAREQLLTAGETAVIPSNIVQHVRGGSGDNQVLVAYWPRFLGDQGDCHAVAPRETSGRPLDSGA